MVLNGSAQATLTTSALATGTHAITAVYSADTNYAASASVVLSQVINSLTKTATTTTLISSTNPVTTGQTIVFTATVWEAGGNTPVQAGSVTFFDGTTSLGVIPLDASGLARLTISTLAAGSHSITATYGPAGTYATSTSAVVTEVVNLPGKTSTTTTVVSLTNPATTGQTVVFTATVAGVGSNTPVPTGTVTFFDGATAFAAGGLSSGQATVSTSTLAAGTHSITAVYGADANYLASTSAVLSEVINQAKTSTTTTVTSSANPVVTGQSVVFTATVAGPCSGADRQRHVHGRDGDSWHGDVEWQWGGYVHDLDSRGWIALDHRCVWGRYEPHRFDFDGGGGGGERSGEGEYDDVAGVFGESGYGGAVGYPDRDGCWYRQQYAFRHGFGYVLRRHGDPWAGYAEFGGNRNFPFTHYAQCRYPSDFGSICGRYELPGVDLKRSCADHYCYA